MRVIYLGVLSNEKSAREKFILLEDGTLLFGRVLYHKDLAKEYVGRENVRVVAAGTLPQEEVEVIEGWGWKSTGYHIETKEEMKTTIVRAILSQKNSPKQ